MSHFVVIAVSLAVALGLATIVNQADQYRQGQIDCIQGQLHYELQEQPNGERLWVEKALGDKPPRRRNESFQALAVGHLSHGLR